MDDLFDCLNASNLFSKKLLNRPLQIKSPSKQFLDEFYQKHQLTTKNNKLSCLNGLRQTVNGQFFYLYFSYTIIVFYFFKGIAKLSSTLLNIPGIDFIVTKKFNGDSTENFFGWLRGNSG